MRNLIKKETYEDKFSRRWWVDNKAKQGWIKFTKKYNNKLFRRKRKEELRKDISEE